MDETCRNPGPESQEPTSREQEPGGLVAGVKFLGFVTFLSIHLPRDLTSTYLAGHLTSTYLAGHQC